MSGAQEMPTNGFGKPRRREVPGAETTDGATPVGATQGGGVSLEDENLSKAALKNKKKREAKKAKEAEAKTGGLTAPASNGNGAQSPSRNSERPSSRSKNSHDAPRASSRRRDGERARGPALDTSSPAPKAASKPTAPVPAAPAPELTVTSPVAGSPQEKKVRSLLKKLRAIDDLKMRQAGGEKLEGTQVLKIGTEEQVRKELATNGYTE
jgi:translation initiation factor 2A